MVPKIMAADLLVFASPLYFWTISSRIKAFIERFYCIAEEDKNPPLGRYERYPEKDCALLMTAADNFFWTFEQAVPFISENTIKRLLHSYQQKYHKPVFCGQRKRDILRGIQTERSSNKYLLFCRAVR